MAILTARAHSVGWLEGVMYCAEFAHSIAQTGDQKLLAERLFENARETKAEAYADAIETDD
jgi:hypothetical protein